MDCPLPLRGAFYNSHLTVICNAYNKCPLCSQCQSFDKHSTMCIRCEARKPAQYRTCNCTAKSKEVKKKAEQVFGRPLFAPEGLDPSLFKQGVNVAEDASYTEAGEALLDAFAGKIDHRLGGSHPMHGLHSVQQVDESTGETAIVDRKGNSYVV